MSKDGRHQMDSKMKASRPNELPANESEREIFPAAAALTAVKRPAYLDAACAGWGEMRARIEQMLVGHDGGGFMDSEERFARLKPEEESLAVDEALDRLAAHDARKAGVVKLRYFAGFSFEGTAEALGISVPTAKREWAYARAWLRREIGKK